MSCFANLFFICIFLISLFLAIRFFYPHFFHLPSRAIFGLRLTDSLYNQISLLPCSISPLANGETISWYINVKYFSERFEPRSHFKRVSMGWWLLRLSAKILALLRLSVNFFQLRLTKKLKINFFCFKKLNINQLVFFVSFDRSYFL